MLEYLKRFEKIIVIVLVSMMALVVLLSTIELGWIIVKDIISPPVLLLEISGLLDVFGFFLLRLIGIELLETIRAYIAASVVRVEVVLLVGIVAIARKVIILDIKQTSSLTLIGIGTTIIALTAGYYLVKQSHKVSEGNIS